MASTYAPAPSELPEETPEPKAVQGVSLLSAKDLALTRRITGVFTVVPLVAVVVAIIGLWGWGITWTDGAIALAMYVFTGLGVTVGYHRLFTHRSFEARRPVRWLFAVAGSMSLQGSVISWVAAHRRHHAYSDDIGDPHSPHLSEVGGLKGVLAGLWHAHLGWMFDDEQTDAERWAPDLLADDTLVRLDRNFPLLSATTFILPAIIGGVVTMSLTGALTAFLWGSLVRIFVLHHITWSINSICHFYGTKPFVSRDESRNNPIMALLSFGEGWHNNHHAFPTSARHGLRGWQFDSSWVVIRGMQLVNLVKDVKVPTPAQMARKTAA